MIPINFGLRVNREIDQGWGLLPDPMERSVAQTWWRSQREPGFFFPSYDEDAFWPTTVPGSYQSLHERLEFFEGLVLYRVHFEERPASGNERVFLHFEGVGDRCRVFLNGTWIGEHDGSHTPFTLEITRELLQQNRLLVYVECKRRVEAVPGVVHDWFHYGGIHRPVRLYRVPTVFIAEGDCRVRLLEDDLLEITARAKVMGGDRFQPVPVTMRLCAGGTSGPACDATVAAYPERWTEHTWLLPRTAAALWEPSAPVFHDFELMVEADTWRERVGLREIRTDGREILLNGAPIFLKGSAAWTIDPQRGIFNMGSETAARTVAALQGLHANFTRAGHAPPSREFVRACDEAGILLWVEVPAYWKPDMHLPAQSRLALKCLEEAVQAFRCSPSVIIWSIGNECAYHDPVKPTTNIAYFLEATRWLKEQDPSRLVAYTGGHEGEANPGDDDRTCASILMRELDVIGLNCYAGQTDGADPGEPDKLPLLRLAFEHVAGFGKPVILAEAGIDAVKDERGFDFGEARQSDYYRKVLKVVSSAHSEGLLQGVCFFALSDFRTPLKLARFQNGYNRKGIMDAELHPKEAYTIVSSAFATLGDSAAESSVGDREPENRSLPHELATATASSF